MYICAVALAARCSVTIRQGAAACSRNEDTKQTNKNQNNQKNCQS